MNIRKGLSSAWATSSIGNRLTSLKNTLTKGWGNVLPLRIAVPALLLNNKGGEPTNSKIQFVPRESNVAIRIDLSRAVAQEPLDKEGQKRFEAAQQRREERRNIGVGTSPT